MSRWFETHFALFFVNIQKMEVCGESEWKELRRELVQSERTIQTMDLIDCVLRLFGTKTGLNKQVPARALHCPLTRLKYLHVTAVSIMVMG